MAMVVVSDPSSPAHETWKCPRRGSEVEVETPGLKPLKARGHWLPPDEVELQLPCEKQHPGAPAEQA